MSTALNSKVQPTVTLTQEDEHTVLSYFASVQRARGYKGPCAISLHKLEELYMEVSRLQTVVALMKARGKYT